MIKANELRIGNWLEFNLHGSKWIGQIDHTDFEFIFDNDLRCANPIPLTEEKLIELGFKQDTVFGKKTSLFDLMPLCGFSYDIVSKKVMILENGNDTSHWIERKIEYVHELQNLYFALTGEELEMKGGENG
jgi:hypothetical protein